MIPLSRTLQSRKARSLPRLFLAAGLTLPLQAQLPEISPVGYTEAKARRLRAALRLPGSVESPKISTVASEVAGLVVELPVREGDRVEKSQVLARLRTEHLALRLQGAQAQLKEDESRRSFARINLKRMRDLLREEVVSQQQLDDAQFEFNAWEGRVERLRAEIDQIQDDVDRSVIRAPFDGVVVTKYGEVGEWLDVGGPVVEVLSTSNLEVQAELPERYYVQLDSASQASIRFDALPGVVIAAPLATIIPRADERSRTFSVRFRLPRSERRVAVGMVADVSIPIGDLYQAVLVPKDAVLTDQQTPRVFVVLQDIVQPVPVQIGAGLGEWLEVRGAVKAGDWIVTRGNERLRPGQRVEPELVGYSLP